MGKNQLGHGTPKILSNIIVEVRTIDVLLDTGYGFDE
jgi:hypothetical protein